MLCGNSDEAPKKLVATFQNFYSRLRTVNILGPPKIFGSINHHVWVAFCQGKPPFLQTKRHRSYLSSVPVVNDFRTAQLFTMRSRVFAAFSLSNWMTTGGKLVGLLWVVFWTSFLGSSARLAAEPATTTPREAFASIAASSSSSSSSDAARLSEFGFVGWRLFKATYFSLFRLNRGANAR